MWNAGALARVFAGATQNLFLPNATSAALQRGAVVHGQCYWFALTTVTDG
jgi:hypothetical protein